MLFSRTVVVISNGTLLPEQAAVEVSIIIARLRLLMAVLVVEILSEHTCQGMLQGYTLTGRTGLFPSYEAFLGIVHTMMVQYAKFAKMVRRMLHYLLAPFLHHYSQAAETSWRQDVGSINYLETSTWTRQEHNGFSHQNPSFIGAVLNLKSISARVYLPPDANCFLSTVSHCLRAKNYVNLMVGSKQPTPVWLSAEEANRVSSSTRVTYKFMPEHLFKSTVSPGPQSGSSPALMMESTLMCTSVLAVSRFTSLDSSHHSVLVGIGVEVTFEVIAAASLLRKYAPDLRVRVVNVTDLMILAATGLHPHALSKNAFNNLFTEDKPIHFNYHGYPIELKGLLFGRPRLDRVSIEGYNEEGTTTSPFDVSMVFVVV